jgi:hypothetical protein
LWRVVDRRFLSGDEEREFAVPLMRQIEAFLSVRVVSYAAMSNHFHLLVEEPDRERLPPWMGNPVPVNCCPCKLLQLRGVWGLTGVASNSLIRQRPYENNGSLSLW